MDRIIDKKIYRIRMRIKMPKLKLLKEVYKETEKEIQNSIMRWLDAKSIFNWPTHRGQIIPARTGISDIIGALPNGRILAIEVKLPSWKPPAEDTKQYKHYLRQKNFIENIKMSNGVAFFASSLGDVKSQLEVVRYPIKEVKP